MAYLKGILAYIGGSLVSFSIMAGFSNAAVYLNAVGKISKAFSFGQSKVIMGNIYRDIEHSFYCGCRLDLPQIIAKGCAAVQELGGQQGMIPLEYEHVLPASVFKEALIKNMETLVFTAKCVSRSRRCMKVAETSFSILEGDLHNIRPVIGKLNRLRGNKQVYPIENELHRSGCGFKLNKKYFEPPDNVKGDIARIHLYMDHKYASLDLISKRQKKIYYDWHKIDPPSQMERKINKRIKILQGDSNIFIDGRMDDALRDK
jgi:deoxyribonuclease I